jgi:hypothetical protein
MTRRNLTLVRLRLALGQRRTWAVAAGLGLLVTGTAVAMVGLPASVAFERATVTSITLLPDSHRALAVYIAATAEGRLVRIDPRSLPGLVAEGDRLCLAVQADCLTRRVSATATRDPLCEQS